MGDLCFDPANPEVMHLSNYQLGVFKSADGGATWTHTLQTKNGFSLVTSPSGQHVYLQCLKRSGLYASHAASAHAAVFHVDVAGGHGSNDGATPATAWAHLTSYFRLTAATPSAITRTGNRELSGNSTHGYSSAPSKFATDILGVTRSRWSMGACEYPGAETLPGRNTPDLQP